MVVVVVVVEEEEGRWGRKEGGKEKEKEGPLLLLVMSFLRPLLKVVGSFERRPIAKVRISLCDGNLYSGPESSKAFLWRDAYFLPIFPVQSRVQNGYPDITQTGFL